MVTDEPGLYYVLFSLLKKRLILNIIDYLTHKNGDIIMKRHQTN